MKLRLILDGLQNPLPLPQDLNIGVGHSRLRNQIKKLTLPMQRMSTMKIQSILSYESIVEFRV